MEIFNKRRTGNYLISRLRKRVDQALIGIASSHQSSKLRSNFPTFLDVYG